VRRALPRLPARSPACPSLPAAQCALSAGGAAPGSGPAEAKLQQQVAATKRADLAALTQQALGLCGLARCGDAPAGGPGGGGHGGAAGAGGAPGAPAGSEDEAAAAALAGAVSVRLLTAACVKAAVVAARAERPEAGRQAARRAGGPRGRGAPGGDAAVQPADAPPSARCARPFTQLARLLVARGLPGSELLPGRAQGACSAAAFGAGERGRVGVRLVL
jgi:hypothetical protein